MRNLAFLLAAFAIVVAFSCDKTPNDPPPPPPPPPRIDPCLSPRPNVVTLNLPDSGAVGVHIYPTFEWCAYPNAVRYRIQISRNPTFSYLASYDRVYYDTILSNIQFYPSLATMTDTTYWRVKAYLSNGDSTPWSSVYNFYPDRDLRNYVKGEFNVKKYRRWTYIDRLTGIYCQNFQDGCLTYLENTRIRVESEGARDLRVTELIAGSPTDTYDYNGGQFKRNVGFAVEQFARYWDNRGILLDSFEIEFETFGTSSGFYSGYLFKGPNPLKR